MDPSRENGPLSRRDFLKLSAAALTAAAFGPKVNRKETDWTQTRFFEDIDHFDPIEVLPNAYHDLLIFPMLFEPQLRAIELNSIEWTKGITRAISSLDRLKKLHTSLKSSDELNESAAKLLSSNFYELGSTVWALLRVKELFKGHPEDLGKALTNPDIGYEDAIPHDPFLGNEIFTINARWTDLWFTPENAPQARTSRIYNILRSPDLLQWISRLESFSRRKEEGLPPKYEVDPTATGTKSGRPKLVDIMTSNPALAQEIMKILAAHRLERATSALFVQTESPLIGTYGNFTPDSRKITVAIDDATVESLRANPFVWQTFLLHEFGHALNHLIPYLLDDRTVTKHKAAIDRLLRHFRPQRSLQTLFQPKGAYTSKLPISDSDRGIADFNKAYKTINEATITDYPASEFIGIHSNVERFCGRLYKIAHPDSSVDAPGFIYRWLPLKEDPPLGTSLQDYFYSIKEKLEHHRHDMTRFEQLIFDRITRNIDIFDARERSFFELTTGLPARYLHHTIIPAVVAIMYLENPTEMEQAIIETFDIKQRSKILHACRQFKNEIESRGQFSDNELFPEVFQATLRRNDPGVTTDISPEIWKEADKVIKDLLDDLINEGLAKNSDSLMVV